MDELTYGLKLELEHAINTGDREAVIALLRLLSALED